jgi:adenine-specific DNA-methyltransferase
VIKYLGSKRRLVPLLSELASASGAGTALDLFTGTTRVAQAFKHLGMYVTAADSARYAHAFARCYIETDAAQVDRSELQLLLEQVLARPPRAGYVTRTFCEQSRYFHPHNGPRIDAVLEAIAALRSRPLGPVLLTSLIEAADRVDSTTGVQMAYLKSWAPRALQPLDLRVPELLAGQGRAVRGDALDVVGALGSFDLAYLDPPYNQHRYTANYHVWETLARGDEPDHYGVACKRVDLRDAHDRSAFNRRATMPDALASCIAKVDAATVIVSLSDESWVPLDALRAMCGVRGEVVIVGVPSRRYVGAQIGIHNPAGERVGSVGRLHNVEYLAVCGEIRPAVRAVLERLGSPSDSR